MSMTLYRYLKQLTLVTSVSMLAFSALAPADTPAPGKVDTLVEKTIKINRLANELKIAIFRSNLPDMKAKFDALETTLGEYPTEADVLCNYFCNFQRASYYLSQASNRPFLLSKSSKDNAAASQAISPPAIKEAADAGIKIIDHALAVLFRQQRNDETKPNRAFHEFTRQSAMLNGLKVRLFMIAGDAWYQSVTNARLKYLDDQVKNGVGSVPQAGDSTGKDESSYAAAYYEQASWTLVEIKTDIPSGDPEFDAVRNDYNVLSMDLKTRMDSIRKGFLFINIDPEAYTNISVSELQVYLQNLYVKVKESEAQIDAIAQQFLESVGARTLTASQQQSSEQGKAMDLSLHKVAALEARADALHKAFAAKEADIRADLETSETRANLRQIEFELQAKLTEFDNQTRLITGRTEQDLLAMSKADQEDRRQELRWLIDKTVTQLNLQLQIDSFEVQTLEYNRQKKNNSNEVMQIVERIGQRESLKKIESERIKQATLEISRLSDLMGKVFANQLAYLNGQVSDIAAKSANVEEVKSKKTAICTLRETLTQTSIDDLKKVGECIKGGGCDGLPAQYANVEELKNATQAKLDDKTKGLEKISALVKAQITSWESATNSYIAGVGTAQGVLSAAEAAVIAVAAIPRVATAVGLGAYVETTVDLFPAAEAAFQVAQRVFETGQSLAKEKLELEKAKDTLKAQLQEFDNQVQEVIQEKKTAESQGKVQLSELLGAKLANDYESGQLKATKQEVTAECALNFQEYDSQIAELKNEGARLQQLITLETSQNELIQPDIEKQRAEIAIATASKEKLASEIRELETDRAKYVEDNSNIDKLLGQIGVSSTRVGTAKGQVEALAVESVQVTQIIQSLSSEQRKNALALRDDEIVGLKKILDQGANADKDKIKHLSETLDTQKGLAELKSRFDAQQKALVEVIGKERNNIVEQATKNLELEKNNGDKQKSMIFASEDYLADIIAGVPDYIETKRRSLASANFAINLLRGRVKAIKAASIAPRTLQSGVDSYTLRSGADMVNAMGDLCDGVITPCTNGEGLFFNEVPVTVVGQMIAIPKNSTLMRTLLDKRRVSFRITPRDLNPDQMMNNGYFDISLGNAKNNATVLAVRAAVSCETDRSSTLVIRHQGVGSWLYKNARNEYQSEVFSTEPRFVINTMDLLNSTVGQTVQDFKLKITKPVDDSDVSVRNFDTRMGEYKIAPQFLGLPLFGSYELVAQNNTCLDGNNDLLLGIIFTESPEL
ncbi:MAG TPA: hypothetical protein VE954_03990 [Oligoflexus sp.]|uniref:hypothetical protein n=1 Tax=Oligoflexus sp. TaxID=1971216 RepID=UPI002D5A4676|nr:hypothetical protein [Oligoflexus sp.]HYX32248.1 hypothetical protein [Oligoflexus sp.]